MALKATYSLPFSKKMNPLLRAHECRFLALMVENSNTDDGKKGERKKNSQAQMIIEFDGIMVVLVRPNFSVSEQNPIMLWYSSL